MISIGINENVVLTKASINDKGTLELKFDELKNLLAEKPSIFESSQKAVITNEGNTGLMLLLFGLKKPDGKRNEDKTDDELLEMISGDIARIKNQLTSILLQYTTSDKIGEWDPYRNTGVTAQNYRERYLDTPTLEMITNNYFTQFVDRVMPFLGIKELPVRLKLIRQSKDKNFPTLPSRYLEENPFIETMDVPAERSLVKFTTYEIEQGMNSSAAISKTDTDAKPAIPDTPQSKESVFGGRR